MSEEAEVPGNGRRRWLPLLGLGGAALLYVTVWQLPALVGGLHRETSELRAQLHTAAGGWVEASPGASLPGQARVRFRVWLERPASLVLIGINSNGRATLYLPQSGVPPRLEAGLSMPAEVTLDGVEGPELFVAVLCHTPLSASVVLKAAERAAAAAETPSHVQTLDLGCPEAHLLLRKEPLP